MVAIFDLSIFTVSSTSDNVLIMSGSPSSISFHFSFLCLVSITYICSSIHRFSNKESIKVCNLATNSLENKQKGHRESHIIPLSEAIEQSQVTSPPSRFQSHNLWAIMYLIELHQTSLGCLGASWPNPKIKTRDRVFSA